MVKKLPSILWSENSNGIFRNASYTEKFGLYTLISILIGIALIILILYKIGIFNKNKNSNEIEN